MSIVPSRDDSIICVCTEGGQIQKWVGFNQEVGLVILKWAWHTRYEINNI